MLRRAAVAVLLLTTAAGCASVSEGDGVIDNLDAGLAPGDAEGDADDTTPGKMDAVDEAAADAPPEAAAPDRPDGGATPDAAEAGADAPGDRGADVPVDRPSTDLGGGTCAEGSTRACYTGLPATRGVGLCGDGFQRCVGARWGVECNGETRPQIEVCNTIDDDCDGTVDNIQIITCYTGPPGTRAVGICHEGMQRCDGTTTPRCMGQVVPQTAEVCRNGMDDNCNGTSDEGCP